MKPRTEKYVITQRNTRTGIRRKICEYDTKKEAAHYLALLAEDDETRWWSEAQDEARAKMPDQVPDDNASDDELWAFDVDFNATTMEILEARISNCEALDTDDDMYEISRVPLGTLTVIIPGEKPLVLEHEIAKEDVIDELLRSWWYIKVDIVEVEENHWVVEVVECDDNDEDAVQEKHLAENREYEWEPNGDEKEGEHER